MLKEQVTLHGTARVAERGAQQNMMILLLVPSCRPEADFCKLYCIVTSPDTELMLYLYVLLDVKQDIREILNFTSSQKYLGLFTL